MCTKWGIQKEVFNFEKSEIFKLFRSEQFRVENQAGERIGVKPPSRGTKSGSARLDLRGIFA